MKTLYVLMLFCMASTAQAMDAFIGTWKLTSFKSMDTEASSPDMMLIMMEQAESGIHYRSETISKSRVVIAEYTAEYDGHLSLVTGNYGLMAPVKLMRIDAHTVEATYIRGLQVVASSRRVLTDDETTMTITTQTYDAERHALTNVGVYRRVTDN